MRASRNVRSPCSAAVGRGNAFGRFSGIFSKGSGRGAPVGPGTWSGQYIGEPSADALADEPCRGVGRVLLVVQVNAAGRGKPHVRSQPRRPSCAQSRGPSSFCPMQYITAFVPRSGKHCGTRPDAQHVDPMQSGKQPAPVKARRIREVRRRVSARRAGRNRSRHRSRRTVRRSRTRRPLRLRPPVLGSTCPRPAGSASSAERATFRLTPWPSPRGAAPRSRRASPSSLIGRSSTICARFETVKPAAVAASAASRVVTEP